MSKLIVRAAAVSDVGNVREQNEDNLYFAGRILEEKHDGIENVWKKGWNLENESALVAVFDGMGGEEHGEIASFLAAQTMQQEARVRQEKAAEVFLEETCQKINQEICKATIENKCKRMGSTGAILLFENDMMYCCNVGDSRIFTWENNSLNQISVDHTNEQMLKELGMLKRKPQLTQYLGIPKETLELTPSTSVHDARKVKKFLICSDGLTDMISEERIAEIMKDADVAKVCRKLLEAAKEAGGRDNITIIVGEVISEQEHTRPGKKRLLGILAIIAVVVFGAVLYGKIAGKENGKKSEKNPSVKSETLISWNKTVDFQIAEGEKLIQFRETETERYWKFEGVNGVKEVTLYVDDREGHTPEKLIKGIKAFKDESAITDITMEDESIWAMHCENDKDSESLYVIKEFPSGEIMLASWTTKEIPEGVSGVVQEVFVEMMINMVTIKE